MKLGVAVRSKEDVFFIKKRYLEYFKDFEIVLLHPYNLYYACDAYAIVGGADANPKLYNEENISSVGIDEVNDQIDLDIIKIAVLNNKPLFGICRGIQMINIFFNGTLKQNVRYHSNTTHKIFLLEEFYFLKDFCEVNSFHHQSIKKLGEGLVNVYSSYDGEIECVVHKDYPIIGVQFHPEMDIESDISLRLLMYFKQMVEKNLFKE